MMRKLHKAQPSSFCREERSKSCCFDKSCGQSQNNAVIKKQGLNLKRHIKSCKETKLSRVINKPIPTAKVIQNFSFLQKWRVFVLCVSLSLKVKFPLNLEIIDYKIEA